MAVEQYRGFLYLKKKHGDQYTLPPSYEIDVVWHAHILHSKDYVLFCEKIFGAYLHHHIHLVDEAKNTNELREKFKKTQELYYKEFGNYIYTVRKQRFNRFLLKIKNCLLKNTGEN